MSNYNDTCNQYQGMSDGLIMKVQQGCRDVHFEEHMEYEANRMDLAEYDTREAELGAQWNGDVFSEWLLTDRDVWIRNPMYQGPRGPHPEENIPPVEEWSDEELDMMNAYAEEYALYVTHMMEADTYPRGTS